MQLLQARFMQFRKRISHWRLLYPFVLAGLIASGQTLAESNQDYQDWYQIEVIIFAQKNPTPGDEVWAVRDLRYPATMLKIRDEEPAPFLLDQLRELDRYAGLMRGDVSGTAGNDSDLFLFENRSRARRNPLREQFSQETQSTPVELLPEVDLKSILFSDAPRAFQRLDNNALTLSRIAGSISRSSRYRMLLHQAWRQPLLAGGDATPVLFQAGSRHANWYEVDGTLTFRRSRFLHVDANLWFTRFAEIQDQLAPAIPSDIDAESLRRYPELLKAEQSSDAWIPVHSHQMTTTRRMRSSTLHYLDHPYFGVVVQIDQFNQATVD